MNIGKIGGAGEQAALQHLEKLGYRVLQQNWQTRFGEVDIIAEKGSYLVFAEVKTRKSGSAVRGVEAVGAAKQQRIIAAASAYLQQNETLLQPRFDVIEIAHRNGAYHVLQHIEDAFGV